MAPSAAASLGFLLLTGNTIMAIRRSRAAGEDAAATAFAAASYASLVLLFYCLRRFETTSPTGSAARAGVWATTSLLKMGVGVVACNSALADHHARGDAGSLALVFVAYAGFVALAWLFLRSVASTTAAGGAGHGQ